MLKIEVYDQSGICIETKNFNQNLIRIGRHSSNDLILANLNISRFELHLEQLPDQTWKYIHNGKSHQFNEYREVWIDTYKLRFFNLSLLDDQKTSHVYHRWVLFQNIFMVTSFEFLFFAIWFFDRVLSNPAILTWTQHLQDFMLIHILIYGPALLISLLSKAINQEYRFMRFLPIAYASGFFFILIEQDLFGLRWILGEKMQLESNYKALHLLLVLWASWLTLKVLFESWPKWVRGLSALCGTLLMALLLNHSYLRIGEVYRFTDIHAPPLMGPWSHLPLQTWPEAEKEIAANLKELSNQAESLKDDDDDEEETDTTTDDLSASKDLTPKTPPPAEVQK